MKNNLKLLILSFLTLFTLSFCSKKTENRPNTTRIDGTWVGTQSLEGTAGTTYLSFTINSDNTLIFYTESGVVSGDGTWTLSDGAFSALLTYRNDPSTTYTYTATLNTEANSLSAGTWGIVRGGANTRGTWTLTKR